MFAFEVHGVVQMVVVAVLVGHKGFAFVAALGYSAQAYLAADKLTKPAWCALTGLGFAAQLILIGGSPLNLIHIAFTIATLVFLADVLPALRQVAPKSGRFTR